MTKVLQIINAMYPFTGGMTQVTEDIMRVLSESGNFEQKIICFNEDAESCGVVTHRNQTVHDDINGVEIIRCGSIAKIASQLISLTFKRELKNVMDSFRPDIVILHYPNPFAAHMLLPLLKSGKYSNVKFILYWHLDIIRQKILGKLFYWQNIKLLERADKIIATSQNYINGSIFLKRYEAKCVIIPCCVQDKRILITPEIQIKADSIRGKYQDKFLSISVGRLVKYKGLDYLIKACEFLDDDFKIFIAGTGPEEKKLKQLSNNNNIIFLGKISNEDLSAYYLASDVISFPSITKNEAFGIALAEGMYFGKPAITFTIPGSGVNYVNIDGLTGIECPNRDIKAFAHSLITLKNDAELRKTLGDNARERVINNFTYETFRDKIINAVKF
ncbi:MAG: glycosyltransferase [Synergistaceae bacterium]|nr:glycosyltransferase [Synergistaceae bacterium]